MLNKYTAALLATVIFGVLFPLSYMVVIGDNPAPVTVAACAVAFFLAMLAVFGRILTKSALQQG